METETIDPRPAVYERLAVEKHEDESFSDTIDRLLDEGQADWRRGLGRDGEEFERVVTESKRGTNIGLSRRTDEVLEAMGFELVERGNVLSYPDGDSRDERTEDTDDGR